ncbi:Isotrichodermin C-15 hydroxylase [Neolecta irregularis DAH-3]|uniref:Isotrichodermin C-15 hydroxylase n=1 Tax=Neolecta irregularis (strain DAH-3) TaxID=1198029 RepID=A0A1U7LHN9_NEOID|nr:Isotrichodermin C-15 hydroxylase [Neolecta irregularis DAH-3]|eukprot:OLL22167.1 Isotrichodermin C-15 hydroxylase [Neolecta irregularis DAH-3]
MFVFGGRGSLFSEGSSFIVSTICALILGYVIRLVFFHPLRHFKGPFWAKINPFWHVIVLQTGQRHKKLRKLHDQYGDVVRICPNAVSICNASAIKDVFGPASSLVKSKAYDALGDDPSNRSISRIRDKSVHLQLRKALAPAFSTQSLDKMEHLVSHNLDLLCNGLLKFGGNGRIPLNLTLWTSFLTFDVLGDLCFTESYGLLEGGRMAPILECTTATLRFGGFAMASPFLASLKKYLAPKDFVEKLVRFKSDCAMRIEKRLLNPAGREDFIHYLLAYADAAATAEDRKGRLTATTETLVLAGTDTTATILCAAISYLSICPRVLSKLREALDALVDLDMTNARLSEIPLLDAIIDETLRICPPLLTSTPRDTTCATYIAEYLIPSNIEVIIPTWAICHDARYFTEPEEWIPERWIDKDYIKDQTLGRTAWQPFSLGPRACIGKNMAYIVLRLSIARLVRSFDFELAKPVRSYEVEDFVAAQRPELFARVRSRSHSLLGLSVI